MAKAIKIQLERWMMPRDRKVITSVYQHGMLNSKQIEYIHFRENKNSKVISLRRLKKMVESGFLKQHWYGWNQYGSMQHFTITNKGAMIVALDLDIDPSNIKVFDKSNIRNIEHTVLIGNFHVGLLKSGYEIPAFTTDYLNRFTFNYQLRTITLESDGKGEIHSPTRIYPFLLEMDRGGMGYEKFTEKMLKYESFYLSKSYKKEYDSFPLVIIVTSNENRLIKLKRIVEKEKKTDVNYLFTTINDLNRLDQAIFHLAGHNQLVALK